MKRIRAVTQKEINITAAIRSKKITKSGPMEENQLYLTGPDISTISSSLLIDESLRRLLMLISKRPK